MRRRGFSTTEVLVGTAIFAVALIPIIGLIAGGTKPTAFNEYHIAAQSIAAQYADRLQDVILSRGFLELEKLPVGDKVALNETKTYKLPADPDANKGAEAGFVSLPEMYLTNLGEPGAGLVQISAVVNWQVPGDVVKHTFTLQRLVARPDAALISDYVPSQKAGGAVR